MESQVSLNPLFSISLVRQAIESGHLILTPNFRLARKIEEAWNVECIQSQLKSWKKPRILALEGWYEQLWQQLIDSAYEPALRGLPLSSSMESWFWEEVIQEDQTLAPDINPDNFVDIAQKGWQLLDQWQLDTNDLQSYQHRGLQHLLTWGHAVEQRIEDKGYVPPTRRLSILEAGFRDSLLKPVDRIVLVGFQTLAPQVKDLFGLAGRNVETLELGQRQPESRQIFAAEHQDEEISAAAQWAQQRLADNPQARIGIVVPQLSALKDKVERIFRHHLEPDWCLPAMDYRETPYNISAGVPLSSSPLVSSAFSLLQLLFDPVDVSQVCLLSKNPFWGDFLREGDVRCRLMRSLLELGFHEVSGSTLRMIAAAAEGDGEAEENSIGQRLIRLATLERSLPKSGSFEDWRAVIVDSLNTLGWPGSRTLDSLEYQQFQHWLSLLDEFASLSPVSGQVTLKRALKTLRTMASNSTFHGETTDCNIQILGVLEAAGLEFDHLWVMNMEERQWPQATAPHPLIPVSLQRELKMPRACPEQELRLSRDLVKLFANSSHSLVFSYAKYDGDIENLPSPLLADIVPFASSLNQNACSAEHPWCRPLASSSLVEIVDDDKGPPFELPADYLPGGSRILADQAQCPFNAFVRWRLGAEPLPVIQSGFSPMVRGQLVHDSLEYIWFRLKDSDGLGAATEPELERLVESAVSSSIRALVTSYDGALARDQIGQRLLKLEEARLAGLLFRWLEEERQRPEFKAYLLEKKIDLALADTAVTLRLDRVDQLPDGKLVVVDYKTGASTSIAGLSQERLVEPQLPLYGLAIQQAFNQAPTALAYGVINPKVFGYKGLSSTPGIVPGCKGLTDLDLSDDWGTVLSEWRKSAEDMFGEFSKGRAELHFHSKNALTYSGDLLPLNRLAEQQRLSLVAPESQGAVLTSGEAGH